MRRAVAHALDRPTLLRALAGAHAGPPNDQFLVPGAPGFRDARIYRLDGPDFARARTEARAPRGRAVLWLTSYPWAYDQPQDIVTSLRRSLRGIGLELVVEKLDNLESRLAAPGAAWDLFLFGDWGPDIPDPSDTLNHLFETGYPAADGVTLSVTLRVADPALDRDLRAAARLSGRARLDAYARLDERLGRDGAAVIPIGRRDQLDSFSERVGCQTFHPLYGIVLGALCFGR